MVVTPAGSQFARGETQMGVDITRVRPILATAILARWGMAVTCHIQPLNFEPFHFRNRRVTAVSLPKPPSGGFGSETAIWIRKWP